MDIKALGALQRESYKQGYTQALNDFEELLDNASSNWAGPTAPRHWDYELRDQIIILRDAQEKAL